jgi:cyclopropane-fatty-acyl-phospholipid synthase
MNATIYVGQISHTRIAPLKHKFQYPAYYYAFDLASLKQLDENCSMFGHNRFRPISLHDKDYLIGEGDLFSKANTFLRRQAPDSVKIKRITLVTAARYFNYVFNPVSFFYCYDQQDQLRHIIVQVTNTFKETHIYLLTDPLDTASSSFLRFRADKEFHVSPMFDREGHYDFSFLPLDDSLDVRMQLVKQDGPAFSAQLRGKARAFSTKNILRTIIQFPLTSVLTMPRIVWQAARLHYQRRLPVYDKPIPASSMTIRKAPATLLQRWCMKQVLYTFEKLENGCLILHLPDGSQREFGNPQKGPTYCVEVKDYKLFTRAVFSGDIGLGESYMAGEWDVDDLVGLTKLFISDVSNVERRAATLEFLKKHYHRYQYRRSKNSVEGSRKNIAAHYDLSNDFYKTFLDETMMYSCAVYDSPSQSLSEAQRNKMQRIIEKADIQSHHHVLELGSGWGGFAIEVAREIGCRVTTVTISKAQFELAKQRIEDAGLEDKIDLLLSDYRQLEGQYDRIVSIEMLEAVGKEYLPTFFRKCEQLLKPHGKAVIQTISVPDHVYDLYSKSYDWIQKHIFPGGHLPSLNALSNVITKHTKLHMDHAENIGPHYAPTLCAWRRNFLKAWGQIQPMGFDEVFKRKWNFYLASCEAGFATQYLSNHQFVLRK